MGSRILRLLLQQNFKVVLLKRSFDDTQRIKDFLDDKNLTFVNTDKTPLTDSFSDRQVNFIIHTATCYGRAGEDISQIVKTNLLLPIELLEMAVKNKVSGFLNADTFFNEKMEFSGKEKHYVRTKKEFVRMASDIIGETEVKFINLKIEQMYGPYDNPTKFTSFLLSEFFKGAPEISLTLGQQERDFIFVDDAAAAFLAVINNFDRLDKFEEFGLGWGKASTLRYFVEQIKEKVKSATLLKWGSLPYRKNEIMSSQADIKNNFKIQWKPRYSIGQGIEEMLKVEFSKAPKK